MSKFRPVTRLRLRFPRRDLVKLLDLLQPREQRRIPQRVQLRLAQVVRAPFHIADIQRPQQALKKRHVLEVELLLQVLRAGRENHPLLPLPGKPQRGQQISQCFARSRARLDDQVPLIVQRTFDRSCHLVLPLAVLKRQRRLRKYSLRREELMQRRQLRARHSSDHRGRRHSPHLMRTSGEEVEHDNPRSAACLIQIQSSELCSSDPRKRPSVCNERKCQSHTRLT